MPGILELAVAALATYRLALLLGVERGPFGLLLALRRVLGPRDGVPMERWTQALRSELVAGLECVWCSSLWLAGPMLLLTHAAPLVAAIMAVSAAAIVIDGIGASK